MSTLRTIAGYLKSLVGRYTPFQMTGNSIEDIYNYMPIDENLATSGQPTAAQFQQVKAQGYGWVINLAPHNAENALPDEAAILHELDMQYIHTGFA